MRTVLRLLELSRRFTAVLSAAHLLVSATALGRLQHAVGTGGTISENFEVRWPAEFAPSSCPVHVRNLADMRASPECVWAWLIHATLWPGWYPNSARVRVLDGDRERLQLGARFTWRTFGISIASTVREFVPNQRIAWDAHGVGVHAYHAWVLEPTASGSRVLTEETQRGWLAVLGARALPNRMYNGHALWLATLSSKAATGRPPSAGLDPTVSTPR
ncbi:MAG: SRPBCC family protein [Gemmatimonadaceae bacterium]